MSTQHIETLGLMEQAAAGNGIIDLLKGIFGEDPAAVVWPGLLGALGEGFALLTVRQRSVLLLRYGLQDGKKRTLDELAPIFGVTRSRIGQIESKALRKLRHPRCSRQLRSAIMFGDFIPIQTFTTAVDDMRSKLEQLSGLFGLVLEELTTAALEKAAERAKTRDRLSDQFARLTGDGVSRRIINVLERARFTKPLEECTDKELLTLRNFGVAALQEVRRYYPELARKWHD